MFGKLFDRGEERPEADPHALPVPRRKSGAHPLRALGDRGCPTPSSAGVTACPAAPSARNPGRWPAISSPPAPAPPTARTPLLHAGPPLVVAAAAVDLALSPLARHTPLANSYRLIARKPKR